MRLHAHLAVPPPTVCRNEFRSLPKMCSNDSKAFPPIVGRFRSPKLFGNGCRNDILAVNRGDQTQLPQGVGSPISRALKVVAGRHFTIEKGETAKIVLARYAHGISKAWLLP